MRKTLWLLVLLAGCSSELAGCSSEGAGGAGSYGDCTDGAAGCREASVHGGNGYEACVCTYYCATDGDCPAPGSGTAVPKCQPYGDYSINGHTADCILPCDETTTCPDGMSCLGSECLKRM